MTEKIYIDEVSKRTKVEYIFIFIDHLNFFLCILVICIFFLIFLLGILFFLTDLYVVYFWLLMSSKISLSLLLFTNFMCHFFLN